MRRVLVLILLLSVAAGAWGAELLALKIVVDNVDPGEEAVHYEQLYFVDGDGRLVRLHTVTRGEFEGDPDVISDLSFRWEDNSVTWDERTESFATRHQILSQEDRLDYSIVGTSLANSQKDFAFTTEFLPVGEGGAVWEGNGRRCSWSMTDGYRETKLPAVPGHPAELLISSQGARLSRWNGTLETDRVLLNRTPKALECTLFSLNETLSGWIPTGTYTLAGPGLWTSRPRERLVHAILLQILGPLPVWAPFVFERDYLR